MRQVDEIYAFTASIKCSTLRCYQCYYCALIEKKAINDDLLVSISLVKFLLVVYWIEEIRLDNSDNSSTTEANLTSQPLPTATRTQHVTNATEHRNRHLYRHGGPSMGLDTDSFKQMRLKN